MAEQAPSSRVSAPSTPRSRVQVSSNFLQAFNPRTFRLISYALAFGSTFVALILTTILWPVLGPSQFVFATIAVTLAAWYGGFLPGMVCAVLTMMLINYFLINPAHTFAIADQDLVRFGFVLFVYLIISVALELRLRSGRKLSQSQAQLQAILQSAPDGITVQRADGTLMFANEAAATLLHLPDAPSIVDKPLAQVARAVVYFDEAGKPLSVPLFLNDPALARGERLQKVVQVGYQDTGERAWWDLKATPVHDENGFRFAINIIQDITERQQAEAERARLNMALVNERARLDELLSGVEAMITESLRLPDGTWQVLYVNQAIERLFGYQPHEWMTDIASIYPRLLHPQDMVRAQAAEAAIYNKPNLNPAGESYSVEYRAYHRDGRMRYVNMQTIGRPDPETGGVRFYSVMTDITERKQADAQRENLLEIVEQQRQRLNNLIANVPGVIYEGTRGPSDSLQIEFVSGDAERIFGYPAEAWSREPDFFFRLIHPDEREAAFEQSRALWQGGEKTTTQEFKMITRDGRTLAVESRSFVTSTDEPEPGSPVDTQSAPAISGFTLAPQEAVDTARIYGVFVDISERRAAEEERARLSATIAEQRARLDNLLTNIPVAIFEAAINAEAKGRITYVNDVAVQWFGYSREEWLDAEAFMRVLIHPDDVERTYAEVVQAQKHGGQATMQFRACTKTGEVRQVETRFTGTPDPETGLIHIYAAMIDVTERKAAEDERARLSATIAEQRTRLDNLLTNAPSVIWETVFEPNSPARVVYVNEIAEQWFGYTREQWLNTPDFLRKLVHPDDAMLALQTDGFVKQRGDYITQFRTVTKTGETLHVEVRSTAVPEPDDGVRVYSVMSDVTERIEAEAEQARLNQIIAEQRARLDNTLSNVPVGLYEADVDWAAGTINVEYVNETALQWFGYPREEWGRGGEFFTGKLIHPDDVQATFANARDLLTNGGQYTTRYRAVGRDGRARDMEITAFGLRNPANGHVRVYNAMTDVTERVQAEAEQQRLNAIIAEQKEQLGNLFANVPAAIWEADILPNGEIWIKLVNDVGLEWSGYSRDEWLNTDSFIKVLAHPDDVEGMFAEAADFMRVGGKLTSRFRLVSKTGDIREIEANTTGVLKPETGIVHFYTVANDVTKRIQAEAEQQRLNAIIAEQRTRFENTLTNVPVAIYEADVSGSERHLQVDYVNKIALEWFGYTRETWADGTHFFTNVLIHPDDVERAFADADALLRKGGQHYSHFRAIGVDGRVRHVDVTVIGILNPANGNVRLYNAMTDVTERVEAEVEQQRLNTIISEQNEQLDNLFTNVPAAIWESEVHPDGQNVWIRTVNHVALDWFGYTRDEWMTTNIFLMKLIHPDDVEAAFKDAADFLRFGGENVSRFRSVSKSGAIRELEVNSTGVLNPKTGIIHVYSVANDVTARNRAEREREQLAQRLDNLLANAPSIIYESVRHPGGETQPVYVNDAVERIIGYTREEWLAGVALFSTITHPDDIQRVSEQANALYATGGMGTIEYRMVKRSGEACYVQLELTVTRDPDGTMHSYGVISDMSERRTAELEREQLTERLDNLLSNMPGIVYEHLRRPGQPTQPVYVSSAMQPLLGLTPEEWLTSTAAYVELIHPDDRERAVNEALETYRQGGKATAEYRIINRRSELLYIQAQYTVNIDPDGTQHIYGVVLDVSERRAAEIERQRLTRRLDNLVTNVPGILWEGLRVRPGVIKIDYVSDAAESLFGYPRQRWIDDENFFRTVIHPEDVQGAFAAAKQMLDTGTSLVTQFRLYTADGRLLYIEAQSTTRTDEETGLPRVYSLLTDITARKAAEAERELLRARLDNTLANVPTAIWEGTPLPNGRISIEYVNPLFTRMFGYTEAEMKAMASPLEALVHPDDIAAVRALREGLLQTGSASSQYRIVSKDGTPTFVEVQASVSMDRETQKPRVYTVAVDISGRKAAELEQERLNRQVAYERLRMANLLANAPGIIAESRISPDGKYQTVFVSNTAERILGYSVEEWTATPGFLLTIVHPEDRAIAVADAEKLAVEGGTTTARFRVITKQGEIRYVETQSTTTLNEDTGERTLYGVLVDVTERERLLRQVEIERGRIANLLANTPSIIGEAALNQDGQLEAIYYNSTLERISGYTEDDWRGKPDFIASVIHPADQATVFEQVAGLYQHGGTTVTQYRVKTKSGEWLPLEAHASTGTDLETGRTHLYFVLSDIRERQKAEAEQQRLNLLVANQSQRLSSLITNVPGVIWEGLPTGDGVLTIDYVNDAGIAMFGYPRERWHEPNFLVELIHPEDRQATFDFTREVWQHGGTTQVQFRCLTAEGDAIYIDLHASIITDERGTPQRIYGVMTDISERKRAEEALAKSALELSRSNEELQQFAYVASHDLQEPLRMVTSYLQLLEARYKDNLDADANEFIGYAVDGAARMKTLINDLLAYSRVDRRGKEFAPVSLNQIVNQAAHNLRMTMEERRVELEAEGLPRVMGDEGQLVQLMQNLLANAIKFTPDKPPHIQISARKEGREWVVSVKDNGIGLDPQYADRIFVIFQRLHGKSRFAGTGIGLAICKKVVERHGGRIWVESRAGEGATFHFTLPTSPRAEQVLKDTGEQASFRLPG